MTSFGVRTPGTGGQKGHGSRRGQGLGVGASLATRLRAVWHKGHSQHMLVSQSKGTVCGGVGTSKKAVDTDEQNLVGKKAA